MEMPEGWKKRKQKIESIPKPQEIEKMSKIVTGTALLLSQEEIDRSERMIREELNLLDLTKEMAEALERQYEDLLEAHSDSPSYNYIEYPTALKKFKEWK